MNPSYLRIADAIKYSGLSRTRIYIALAQGKISARKAGRATLIERISLDRYLAELPEAVINIPSAA